MRSGIYLQRLHPSIIPLDQDEAILVGATREIEEQRATRLHSKKPTSATQSRTSNTPSMRAIPPLSQSLNTQSRSGIAPTLMVQRMLRTQGSTPSGSTTRNCRLCGKAGHNSRTCPSKDPLSSQTRPRQSDTHPHPLPVHTVPQSLDQQSVHQTYAPPAQQYGTALPSHLSHWPAPQSFNELPQSYAAANSSNPCHVCGSISRITCTCYYRGS